MKKNQKKNLAQKNLDEFKQNMPVQLEMFTSFGQEYSRSLELYDFIPKYFRGKKVKRIDGKYLEARNISFTFRKKSYNVTISPARIVKKDEQGKIISEKDYYPGKKEEIVEEVLKKMACSGKGVFLEDNTSNYLGVLFSLYEVQKELSAIGKSYNIPDIKEAILINNKANIDLVEAGRTNDPIISESLFPTIGLTSKNKKGDQKAWVRFNSLVTKSVLTKTFRSYNYSISMSISGDLATYIFKRISHIYTYAAPNKPYDIKMTTLLNEGGFSIQPSIKHNERTIDRNLDELIKKEILVKYSKEELFHEGKKKPYDIYYHLYSHSKFWKEMKKFNALDPKRGEGGEFNISEDIRKICTSLNSPKKP